MRNTLGNQDHVAGDGAPLLISHHEPKLTIEDMENFIFGAMTMERRRVPIANSMLNYGDLVLTVGTGDADDDP